MGDEARPVIHLEITVPRIVFSAGMHPPQQSKTGNAPTTTESEQEQVRVLLPEQGERRFAIRNVETAGRIASEPVTYGSAGSFRLFQLKDIPRQGQKLLLQVLRRLTGTAEHFSLTAEQAFSLEFRQLDASNQSEEQATTSSSQLVPGLNQIVIYLDKDGTVVNVNIDGAES